MITYKQSLTAQKLFRHTADQCRNIGIDLHSRNAEMQLLTCFREGLRQSKTPSGRAFDVDMTGEMRKLLGADECDGRVFDEDLAEIRGWIETRLGQSGDPRHRKLLGKLRAFLDEELARDSSDEQVFRGKAMKDMEADGRRPWDAYESGASRGGRERLRQDRALAARAADSRPRGFLGRPAMPDSDLARMEQQAMETFGL